MHLLSLALIGFSLFSALSLALGHFRAEPYRDQAGARWMGWLLLAALAGLQWVHLLWLEGGGASVTDGLYRVLLFAVAPAFYGFARPLLQPDGGRVGLALRAWHGLPVLAAPFLSPQFALPLAFMVGAGYLAWLGRCLYRLRGERENFRREMALLGLVFGVALAVAVLALLAGLMQAMLPGPLFYQLYASSIGVAFFLVQTSLLLRPELAQEVEATARTTYATSTLSNLDCPALLARLEQLMTTDKLYLDPDLSLAGLAERLGISGHQLSELLNGRLGKGFARYLREVRVAAAQDLLMQNVSASVLSVGLAVGFTAQSNFYEAFREIAGTTPGQYRRLQRGALVANGRTE